MSASKSPSSHTLCVPSVRAWVSALRATCSAWSSLPSRSRRDARWRPSWTSHNGSRGSMRETAAEPDRLFVPLGKRGLIAFGTERCESFVVESDRLCGQLFDLCPHGGTGGQPHFGCLHARAEIRQRHAAGVGELAFLRVIQRVHD